MNCEKLGAALDDLAETLRVDDDAPPVSQNNLLAVEFIQMLRDLLARGADDAGERLVADGQGDRGAARAGGAEMLRQIRQLKSDAPAQIKADAADAVDIGLSVQVQSRGEAQEKVFIRGAQQGFNENLRFDETYRRGLKGVAPESVARVGHERVE